MAKRKLLPKRPRTKRPRPSIPENIRLRKPKRIAPAESMWTTKDHRMIPVSQLSHLHLLNAARMLLRQSERWRAEHDALVRSLISFHGERSEFARLIVQATRLSDFDFMARYHNKFRVLWSELVRRRLAWVVQEDMRHPENALRYKSEPMEYASPTWPGYGD